jgi:putative heme-binding domain-containing protein
MEGGNAGYFSSDGTRYWQADQRPGQDVFTAHWHQEDPGVIPAGDRSGAGAPTGVVVYEGDALGENYRGMLLSADAGRNVVFAYHPKQHQSGYDLGKRSNFITSLKDDNEDYVWNDSLDNRDVHKWFRPSDVAVGIEGAIYVADWYDPVVGGHQMEDSIGYGRIYRIQPKAKRLTRPTVDMSSTAGQLEALLNPAVNVRFEASQKLAAGGDAIIPELKKLLGSENDYHRARAVWLMSKLGNAGKLEVEKLLQHADEDIRTVAFRALRQYPAKVVEYAKTLVDDPSPFIRREILVSLTDLPYTEKKPILLSLLKNFDPGDRWFVEAFGTAASGHEEELMNDAEKILNPENLAADSWNNKMEALVWRLHPPGYIQSLAQRAQSDKLNVAERKRAITALAFINDRRAVVAMLNLAKSSRPDVAEQATYWIAFRQSNDWFQLADWAKTDIDPAQERKVAVMKVRMSNILDEKMPWDEKKRSARDMARDVFGSKMILAMVADQKFPKELYNEVGGIILTSTDQAVRVQASQYFQSDNHHAYSIPSIAKLRADPENGKLVFEGKCATCHRVGSGGKDIGPELTTIGKKFDKEAMVDAVVNPSAGIVFGYEAWTINTKDGQSHFGFLIGDSEKAVVIKDVGGTVRTIAVSDITSRQKAEKSLMPDASALGMNDQELADVIGYLSSIQ